MPYEQSSETLNSESSSYINKASNSKFSPDADAETFGKASPMRLLETSPPVQSRGDPLSDEYLYITTENQQRALDDLHNIENLDLFFSGVYQYYAGGGLSVILLSKITTLLIHGFLGFFFFFMVTCIDYQSILDAIRANLSMHQASPSTTYTPFPPAKGSSTLNSTSSPFVNLWDYVNWLGYGSTSFFWSICLLIFIVHWFWNWMQLLVEWEGLVKMQRYFTCILQVSDNKLEELSMRSSRYTYAESQGEGDLSWLWDRVLTKTPSHFLGDTSDVLSIANRVMRKDNYLTAMINKNLLNIKFPVPYFSRNKQLTKNLEWNIRKTLLDFIFQDSDSDKAVVGVRPEFLRESNAEALTEELVKRFKAMAIFNFLMIPFLFIYLLVYVSFKYGEEMYRNPKNLSQREYTNYALWKFREFNEFPCVFEARISQTIKPANKYIAQDMLPFFARCILKLGVFVIASLAFAMIMAGLISEELLLYLELSNGRTLLWYAGVLGLVLAIFRSLSPPRDHVNLSKHSAESLMREIIRGTHYYPVHWKTQYNDDFDKKEIRLEFSKLYDYQWQLFVKEILSVFVTPLILWYSLPQCAKQVVDFVREFTVHVEGLGYICSFSLFDLSSSSDEKLSSPTKEPKLERRSSKSKHAKLEKSIIAFKDTFPQWIPKDPSASCYLSQIQELYEQDASSGINPYHAATTPKHPTAKKGLNHESTMESNYLLDYNDSDASTGIIVNTTPNKERFGMSSAEMDVYPSNLAGQSTLIATDSSSGFPINHYLQPMKDSETTTKINSKISRPNASFMMTQSSMYRQIQKGNPSLIDIFHKYCTKDQDTDSKEQQNANFEV